MLGSRVFGKRGVPPVRPPSGTDVLAMRALSEAIAEKRPGDPQIGERLGSDDLLETLAAAMARRDARGVHAETLIAALASLAGFACVMSAIATVVESGSNVGSRLQLPGRDGQPVSIEIFPINRVTGVDGQTFYAGEAINRPLLEDPFSVAAIITGLARNHGIAELPDLRELVAHVAASLGTAGFGIPRPAPGGHLPSEPPIAYVRAFWPVLLPRAKVYCPRAQQWPALYALATQKAIELCRDKVPPAVAIRLALECAVPMSKVDPQALC